MIISNSTACTCEVPAIPAILHTQLAKKFTLNWGLSKFARTKHNYNFWCRIPRGQYVSDVETDEVTNIYCKSDIKINIKIGYRIICMYVDHRPSYYHCHSCLLPPWFTIFNVASGYQ